jgi:hypothetical protein
MSISVTGRQGIWNRKIDMGLLLNFGEYKIEVRAKRRYYLLSAMPLEASNERVYIIEILMGGLRDV